MLSFSLPRKFDLDMFVFWIVIAVAVGWVFLRMLRDQGVSPFSTEGRETPLETLRRRYAEGEISTEEYEDRKRRLD